MIQIISKTPIYVWPLLIYLIWSGWKSREDHVISWKSLSIMPTIMFLWSFYSMMAHYKGWSIALWATSLTTGAWIGSLTVRNIRLRFDKQKNLIEIAGNWTPMILSITIFFLRYLLKSTYGLYPSLVGSHKMLALECLATIISGMFSGRLIGYYIRSKTASHIDLKKAKT